MTLKWMQRFDFSVQRKQFIKSDVFYMFVLLCGSSIFCAGRLTPKTVKEIVISSPLGVQH